MYSMSNGISWMNNWFEYNPEKFKESLEKWCINQEKSRRSSGKVSLLVFELDNLMDFVNKNSLESKWFEDAEQVKGTGWLKIYNLTMTWNNLGCRAEVGEVFLEEELLYAAPETFKKVSGITYISTGC